MLFNDSRYCSLRLRCHPFWLTWCVLSLEIPHKSVLLQPDNRPGEDETDNVSKHFQTTVSRKKCRFNCSVLLSLTAPYHNTVSKLHITNSLWYPQCATTTEQPVGVHRSFKHEKCQRTVWAQQCSDVDHDFAVWENVERICGEGKKKRSRVINIFLKTCNAKLNTRDQHKPYIRLIIFISPTSHWVSHNFQLYSQWRIPS